MQRDQVGEHTPYLVPVKSARDKRLKSAARTQFSPNLPNVDASIRNDYLAREISRGWRTILLNAALLVPLTDLRREALGDALETYAGGDILELDVALREAHAQPDQHFEAIRLIGPYLSEEEKAAMVHALLAILNQDGTLKGRRLAYVKAILGAIKPRAAEARESVPGKERAR